MKKFTCVGDIGPLDMAVAEALQIKKDRFTYSDLGRNKTLLMIFFNSSWIQNSPLSFAKSAI